MNILTCIYALFLFVSFDANTQVFVPKENDPLQELKQYLQVAKANDSSLTIDQVKKGQLTFKPLSSFPKLDVYKTWWLKLEMLPHFSSDSFYIGLPPVDMSGISKGNDITDVWIFQGDQLISTYQAGILTPNSKKVISNPNNQNLFPVQLKQNISQTIYWRISKKINFEALQLAFALQHSEIVFRKTTSMEKLAFFYTGVMLILFFFGLIFLIITRERSFIWFTIVAGLYCLHMQVLHPNNPLTNWLFPENPQLQFHLFAILTLAGTIIMLQLIRSFTRLKTLLPKWDKVTIGIMIANGLLAATSLLFLEVSPTRDLPEKISILIFLSIVVVTVKLILQKEVYARVTGIAMLWLFIFQILGVLWNNGVIPASFPNPWPIAQIGMMVILFFALAYRFKQSAKEKAEASKMREMDAIKSRFFANISHEFRTPLTLMLGPLKQMEENSLDPVQQKKYLRVMRRNGDRLLQLINQLLDLSKLESGKMGLNVVKTDITALLKTIAASFESLAEQQQVNYHIHFPEEPLVGFVDKDKLEKIVVNLLSNAFRFTASNGTVSFSVSHDDKRVRFTVQDDGVGMPKEQLDKIFDRFHQVSGTEGGTGIGLSLAKELLQLHKGQISVQSETGKGSSFRVSIPITAESYSKEELKSLDEIYIPSATSYPTVPGEEEEETVGVNSNLPVVLIAEDNKDLQQYIADVLRNYFQVHIAPNGKMALEKAKDLVPDCILTDVMMPEMNGIDLCREIKTTAATSHIPVVMLTARAGLPGKMEGLQTGADDYLVKPFDGPELIIRIQNLIEQRKQLREKFSRQVLTIQPDQISNPSLEQEFITTVRKVIDENIDNELFGVAELANAVHLSRSQLHRKLKALTGQAPNELIRNYRLERAFQLLEQRSGNITEIAYQTGFSSPAYFTKCFSEKYGYPPTSVKTANTTG